MRFSPRYGIAAVFMVILTSSTARAVQMQHEQGHELARLVSAMLGETPMVSDLLYLNDVIGGRATGSEANLRSVEWTLSRFQNAGVAAQRESFTMRELWL